MFATYKFIDIQILFISPFFYRIVYFTVYFTFVYHTIENISIDCYELSVLVPRRGTLD